MTLLELLVLLAVVAVVAAVAAGLVPAGVRAPASSVPEVELAAPLDEQDVRGLRFAVGLRGYRMDQVDSVLDVLTGELAARSSELAARDVELAAVRAERTSELAERDAEIARLRGQ